MTQEQKRIKIAEVCNPWNSTNREGSKYTSWADYVNRVCGAIDELPDYFNDLNAMHEAEKILTDERDRPIIYWEKLEEITGCCDYDNRNETRKVVCATAAQRAEAFGRTLELWT